MLQNKNNKVVFVFAYLFYNKTKLKEGKPKETKRNKKKQKINKMSLREKEIKVDWVFKVKNKGELKGFKSKLS